MRDQCSTDSATVPGLRFRELEYYSNGIVRAIFETQNRGVVDLWRWSVRKVLLYIYIYLAANEDMTERPSRLSISLLNRA